MNFISQRLGPGKARRGSWRSRLPLALLTLGFVGCSRTQSPQLSLDQYRRLLTVSDVRAFYFSQPGSNEKVPQVRGTLRNLSPNTLIAVELSLAFRDPLGKMIHEEKAYPVYVSGTGLPALGKPLGPDQEVKFAFKSPDCPRDWEPGQVDVRVTKVVPQP